MRKFHEIADDDPIWTESAALTVGSVARALSDSKSALSAATKLGARVDDVDDLLDDILKSNAVIDDCLKAFAAKNKALTDDLARIAEKIDVSGFLAKAEMFERSFHARQHADYVATGAKLSLDDWLARIEADREAVRKRDELTKYDFDDDGAISVERRPDALWKVVR